jgi:dipeptidyl aminopeptidase/acylaminoacyl peptidase
MYNAAPLIIVALLVVTLVLLAAGVVIYLQLTAVDPRASINLPNTPDQFKVRGGPHIRFDTAPYAMPVYETMRVPSRQAGIGLAAWMAAAEPSAPAVLLTHGLRQGKCDSNVLTAAGMLHRHGFNVLLIDLRNHGQSDVTNGRAGFGAREWLDVLGAWDWLVGVRGFPPRRVGLYGVSMGAATTLIAFAREPRAAAAFVEAPFYDVRDLLADQLARHRLPPLMADVSLFAGQLLTGDRLRAASPREGIARSAGRPLYLVHGTADQRIDLRHHRRYAALASQAQANATAWVVEGAGHIEAAFVAPAEYERRLVDFFTRALSGERNE